MASVHKQPGRPFYFGAYTDTDGTRRFRSTETRNRQQAETIARAWEKAAKLARTGRLTPERAREVIAAGIEDTFLTANNAAMPRQTVKAWCTSWLEAKKIGTAFATWERYRGVIDRFVAFMGKRTEQDLELVRVSDIRDFRDAQAKKLSVNSANLGIKVLRHCLGTACKEEVISSNPATKVDVLKTESDFEKQPFTVEDIQRILTACKDTEWRGIVLFGMYTGQRLGDIARVRWSQIDLERNEFSLTARKTKKRMHLPLPRPLVDYLTALPSTDDPDTPIFSKADSVYAVNRSTLSNQFQRVLVDCGLAEAKPHRKTGEGRDASRVQSPKTFHSLRHTARTELMRLNVPDAVINDILGHSTKESSERYTHVNLDDKRAAMDRLTDVTAAPKKGQGKE